MNYLSRRQYFSFSFGVFISCGLRSASSKESAVSDYSELSSFPPLPQKYNSISDSEPMNEEFTQTITQLGTGEPSNEEVSIARDIDNSVPKNALPVEIAGYLLEVARGNYGEVWRPYTRAWPKDAPANPLILSFFKQTKTKPEGDTTAWCAAFLNWCLQKSIEGREIKNAISPPTGSASSGSFRTWGTESIEFQADGTMPSNVSFLPKVGDVVVFKLKRSDGTFHPSRGHVGFFIEMEDNRIRILGGNQYEGKPNIYAINTSWMLLSGKKLQIHSIRRSPILSM